MNALVDAINKNQNKTTTENGMPAKVSTSDHRLDFFYKVPSQRKTGFKKVGGKFQSFVSAFDQNPTDAVRILFWLRDIREGSGERNSFRGIVNLAASSGRFPSHLVELIPEYGRWDDLLCLMGTPLESEALSVFAKGLKDGNKLAAKWCPRLTSSKRAYANKIRKELKLDPKNFRKLLSTLTNAVETDMCAKNWSDIDYSKVPSVALSRYTAACARNDEERFSKYVIENELNGKDLFPHDVMRMKKSGKVKSHMVDAMWKGLPSNLISETEENILPVVDVSGSMSVSISGSVTAMDAAISLGLYLAQNMDGDFKNHFVTFSSNPTLVSVGNRSFSEAADFMRRANWNMNTNIEAVFNLVLNTATSKGVDAEDMPTKIVIFSDMQFDRCAKNPSKSFMNSISKKYKSAGYALPKIVFWNLNSKSNSVSHADADDGRATLVGGFSTNLMKTVFNDTKIEEVVQNVVEDDGSIVEKVVQVKVQKTPVEMMEDVIYSERYSHIFA